jgi:hypothetical protein
MQARRWEGAPGPRGRIRDQGDEVLVEIAGPSGALRISFGPSPRRAVIVSVVHGEGIGKTIFVAAHELVDVLGAFADAYGKAMRRWGPDVARGTGGPWGTFERPHGAPPATAAVDDAEVER